MKINVFFMLLGTRPAIKNISDTPLNDLLINNIPIKRVEFVKNLGLTYDEILSWRKQINLAISRAMGNYISIARFQKFLSLDAKKILCESMVLSQFNFCDVAYLNIDIYLQKKIQKIQNLCLRFIFNIKKSWDTNYDVLMSELKWLNMNQRRISHGLVLLFKVLNGLGPTYLRDMFTQNSEISTRVTRTFPGNIWIPNIHYTATHSKAFRLYISNVWNQLPNDVKSLTSVFTFKNKIKSLFLNELLVLPPY